MKTGATMVEWRKRRRQLVGWIVLISCVALIAVYQVKRVDLLQGQLATLEQQQSLTKQSEQWRRERDKVRQQLEAARRENLQLRQQAADVNRLRRETNDWRSVSQELAHLKAD